MKHLLTFALILTSWYGFSQFLPIVTTPDATICQGDCVTLSSSTSPNNGSPIVNTIWSVTGPNSYVFAGSTLPGTNLELCDVSTQGSYSISIINQFQDGNSSGNQFPDFFSVVAGVNAAIGATVTSCNVPFAVQYGVGGSSAGADITYAWTFQSGNPATFSGATPPIINYTTPGGYNVGLVVTNTTTGCTASATRTMNVSNFNTDFTLPATICVGQAAQLNDNSTVGVNSWSWSATPGVGVTGSGSFNTAGSENPTATFSAAGTYTITLASSNTSVPCNSTKTATITVLALPGNVGFTNTSSAACAPSLATFTNTTPNQGGSTFVWNFGNGSAPFTGATPPNQVYTGNGSFTPSVTVTGANGCVSSFLGTPVVLSSPTANFTVDQKDGCQGNQIGFTDISTVPSPITAWNWNFFDGSPASTLQNPTHTFLCGEYDVRLIITIAGGCKDTVLLSTNAVPLGNGYTTVGAGAPNLLLKYGTNTNPAFFLDKHNECIKKPITLTENTNIACPHKPEDVKRQWFINGVPDGTDSVYLKIFPDTMLNIGPNGLPGTDIWLEINFRGCRDTTFTEDSIYISAPISKFTLSNTLFCDVNQQPVPQGTGAVVTVFDTESIYSHQFPISTVVLDSLIPSIADDDIQMKIKWGDGFYNNVDSVTVVDLDSDLDDDPSKGGTISTSTANTTGSPLSHTYNNYGTYVVEQVITNFTTGCADSTKFTVNVSWVATDYVFSEATQTNDDLDSVCINNQFTMVVTTPVAQATHANGQSSHSPLSYSFGGGAGFGGTGGASPNTDFSSSINQPSVPTLSPATSHLITLTTTNAVGCSATATGNMTAFALPIADLSLNVFNGCVGVPYTSIATNNSTHPVGSYGAQGPNSSFWAPNGFAWTANGVNGQTTSATTETYTNSITQGTTVTLTATDAFGCVSIPASVQANVQQPTAGINIPPTVCNSDVPGNVIIANGNGTIVNYAWIIDGTPSPLNQPTIPFPASWVIPQGGATSATHTVQLVVIDNLNCASEPFSQTITIRAPQAAFTANEKGTAITDGQTFDCPPLVVNFTDASTGLGISNHAWQFNLSGTAASNFGELGTCSTYTTQQDPQGIQFIFGGTYDLRYIISDDAGCIDTLFMDNYIIIGGPRADVDIVTNGGQCGQDYTFNITNPVNVSSWSWNLGDGTIEQSANHPTNTFNYSYTGVTTYYPIVTLVDAVGCAVPYRDTVVILPNGVDAFFTANPTEINLGTTVTFNPTGSLSVGGNLNTWAWNFGDGTGDTLNAPSNVSNQYYIGGNVPVTLTVTDDRGCKDNFTVLLVIDVKFDLPNVLTGKGTDLNADFALFADVFKDFEVTIVNRWGNVVHEGKRDSAKPRFLWDGIDLKSGKLCNEGTYYYLLKGVLKNDVPVDAQGFVTLIGTVK